MPIYQDSVADEMGFVLAHAGVKFAVVREPGAGRQGACGLRPGARASPSRLRRAARHARLRPCAAQVVRGRAGHGPRRGPEAEQIFGQRLGEDDRRRQGLGRGGDPLHLGHHRQPEGRDALLRQRDHRLAQRQQLRSSHRERRSRRLSAHGLGRRSHLLLCPVLCRRLLRQLPGEPGDGGRGSPRDRHHLCSSRRRASTRTC